MLRRSALLVLALAALGPLPPGGLSAQVRPPARPRPDIVSGWQERLVAAERLLQQGEWKKAKKHANWLLAEMSHRIESGPGAGRLLGLAAFIRAVAEVGLGDPRNGAWDWQMATAMEPELANLDLSRFGEPGRQLMAGFPTVQEMMEEPAEKGQAKGGDLRPPKKINAPAVRYPSARRVSCLQDQIVVKMVIDRDGIPRLPQMATEGSPVLFFAAMDTLRHWRFRPARLGGEPVAVIYKLTVNFSIEYCPDAAARYRAAKRETVDSADQ